MTKHFKTLVLVCCVLGLTAGTTFAVGMSDVPNPLRAESTTAAHDLKEAASLLDRFGADLTGTAAPLPSALSIPTTREIVHPAAVKGQLGAWSMVGGKADRTSAADGPVDPSNLALLWQYTGSTHAGPLWGPIVAGGTAIYTTGYEVEAVDAATGKLNWKWLLPRSADATNTASVAAPPAYAAGRLYIAGANSILYVRDAASGKPVQQVQLDAAATSAPAVTEDALYLATANGTVYAFRLAGSGGASIQLLWSQRPAPGETIAVPVAVQGTGVYVATSRGKVFGLQRATGVLFAKTDIGSVAGVQGIAATSGTVMVASGRSLYRLSAADLSAHWARSYPAPITGAPAYSEGVAFLVTASGILYATPLGGSGQTGWSVNLGTPSETQPGFIVAGGVVIVSWGGRVYGFATAGDGVGRHRLLWQYSPPADAEYTSTHPWMQPEITALALAGGDFYVLARTGVLTCLSADAIDKAGPTVDLRYPEGGRYAPQDISGIVARVQDRESGYLKGSLKLVVDGAPVPYGFVFEPDTGRLTYTPPQAFSAGVHTVRVVAADNRNNWSETQWSFVVDPAANSTSEGSLTASSLGSIDRRSLVGGVSNLENREGTASGLPRGIAPPGGSYFVPNYVRELRPLTHWAHFPLSVYFVRDSEFTLERQNATTAGFSRWVDATGSAICYCLVNDPALANVTVRFDPTKCDGITYTESVGSRIEKADVNLGVALPGNNSQHMPLLDLACVAAHEFGHTLGLNGHSSDPSDVMFFQHMVGQPWRLTSRDINTLRVNYAPLFGAASPAG